MRIDFQTAPSRYQHWRLAVDGEIATLVLDVNEDSGLAGGYLLKQNSYDLGVDIELADAVQRLRFEQPAVKAVVLRSGKERIFCAGANIRMLANASHAQKVNFCKFTNETRNAIEDASRHSGQHYLSALRGTAAGGGYELAMATEHILLSDDGNSAVALPELPRLAVLPGTGGLTRLTDKRKVRRDLADVFCGLEEGVKGERALRWGLVDELAPNSRFADVVKARAAAFARLSDRPMNATGISLTPLDRSFSDSGVVYSSLRVELDRGARVARLTLLGPDAPPALTADVAVAAGAAFWPLRLARELDDAILHLRLNEPEIGVLVFTSQGDPAHVLAFDRLLDTHADHWLVREIRLLWKRVLKRIDVTSRSLVALVEPGSCFAGTLAESLFACDRTYMLTGTSEEDTSPAAAVVLNELNFGAYPMGNGLARLETRFWGHSDKVAAARNQLHEALDATACESLSLVTVVLDDIDWDDEIRIFLEERASFSPDGLSGLEANLRFAGPETMETKIFGRLSAWQNWIFQRPNAVGEAGALRRYGTGRQPEFDPTRV